MDLRHPVNLRRLRFWTRPAAALLLLLSAGIATPLSTRGAASKLGAAPGGPGAAPYWAIGRKDGVGSAFGSASNVWYTLAGGQLTEVFYPTTDTPDTTSLSFTVTDGRTFADLLPANGTCVTIHPDARSEQYVVRCTGRGHVYRLDSTYLSDPARPSVLVHLRLTQTAGAGGRPLQVYMRFDPALNANGTNDSGHAAGTALLAHDDSGHYGPVASALIASPPLSGTTTAYAGAAGDPTAALHAHFTPGRRYAGAGPGNIVQGAYVPLRGDGTADVCLAFGPAEATALHTATASLARPFAETAAAFDAGWHAYAAGLLQPAARVTSAQRDQYFTAALALKASEDRRFPGAIVASLSTPWGRAVPADQGSGQGYHRVWTRDLFEMATGFIATGDLATARGIVRYMLDTLEEGDGSMPQNSLVDGTAVDAGIQLDQVAYPLILAWTLGIDHDATYMSHLRLLADYLVRKGPITDEERWEENAGYSPSTIAAEIAGLTAAASIAEKRGDRARSLAYQAVADDWQRNVKAWTVTSTGSLARHPYFIRIDDNTDPNDGDLLDIRNGGPATDERGVVDAGFLELVRLGILAPADKDVVASLAVVDSTIRVVMANGPAWYRYNHDGYGDQLDGAPWTSTNPAGSGHPWPVLDGERGEYELSLGHGAQASYYLDAMRRFASPSGMIPEQVWEKPAVPTSPPGTSPDAASIGMVPGQADGSADPLNWALAQYVRLSSDVQAGSLLDQPSMTRARYVTHPVGHARLQVTAPAADIAGNTARTLTVAGKAAPGAQVAILATSSYGAVAASPMVRSDGSFSVKIAIPAAFLIRVNVTARDTVRNTALVVRLVHQ